MGIRDVVIHESNLHDPDLNFLEGEFYIWLGNRFLAALHKGVSYIELFSPKHHQ